MSDDIFQQIHDKKKQLEEKQQARETMRAERKAWAEDLAKKNQEAREARANRKPMDPEEVIRRAKEL